MKEEPLICWLYISRTSGLEHQPQLANQHQNGISLDSDALSRVVLEGAIRACDPKGPWHISETRCGLIAGFARETDADKLLQRRDLACVFQTPVQVIAV